MTAHAEIPYNAVHAGYFAWRMGYRDCTPTTRALRATFGKPLCDCGELAPHNTGMCARCAEVED